MVLVEIHDLKILLTLYFVATNAALLCQFVKVPLHVIDGHGILKKPEVTFHEAGVIDATPSVVGMQPQTDPGEAGWQR